MDSSIEKIIEEIGRYGNFLIGTAASAHQVEGGNYNDWSKFERIEGNIRDNEQSGRATNHYELFDTDFSILEELGFRAHRLSIEWSRIIPEEGSIDTSELEHYREVLQSLQSHNLFSFVTLHHFTSPVWFMEKGGFEHRENLHHWKEFVQCVCRELGDLIDVFNTINEPYVYAATGYLQGTHSPGKKSLRKYFKVGNNLMRAHFMAVEEIRALCAGKPVGLVKNLIEFTPNSKRNPIDRLLRWIFDWGYNRRPLKSLMKGRIPFGFRRIPMGDRGDFIGINFYNKMTVGLGIPDRMMPYEPGDDKLTQMQWGVYPTSLKHELAKAVRKVHLPVFITENGIATSDDDWRKEYILQHLSVIADLLKTGYDIRGYFYWSNIDNFEWAEGFYPKFGLTSFDPVCFERTVKDSGRMLGSVAETLWSEDTKLEF